MKTTYFGSCHCEKVRFEVDIDLIEVRACDCTICIKRGALIYRVDSADFRLLTPLENMVLYQWHTRTAKDYFCATCGVLPFKRPRTAPHLWAVNIRCLDEIDLSAIPINHVHGSRLS
ncbi:MAG: GFA family protein [Paracoccaceae bacterium]